MFQIRAGGQVEDYALVVSAYLPKSAYEEGRLCAKKITPSPYMNS